MNTPEVMAPSGWAATYTKRFTKGGKDYVAYESYPYKVTQRVDLCEITPEGEKPLAYKEHNREGNCYETSKWDHVNERGYIRSCWDSPQRSDTFEIRLQDGDDCGPIGRPRPKILKVTGAGNRRLKDVSGLKDFEGINTMIAHIDGKSGNKSLPAIFEFCQKFGREGKEAFIAILKNARI